MKRIETAMIIGLILALLTSKLGVFAQNCELLRENTLRLHVIAHSDLPQDQEIKLLVRDAVLAGTGDIFTHAHGKTDAAGSAKENLPQIQALAQRELDRHPGGYQASASLVRMPFDTTVYGGFTMPAGEYDAVRVTIGSGSGKNWWCVLFPPLCVAPAGKIQGEFDIGDAQLISSQPEYIPAFAVVELIQKLGADRK